jgi:hypothetical protein
MWFVLLLVLGHKFLHRCHVFLLRVLCTQVLDITPGFVLLLALWESHVSALQI